MVTIQLTPEQSQALAQNGAEAVRAVDPRDSTEYVLLRADLYQRFKAAIDEAEDEAVQNAIVDAAKKSTAAWIKENPF